MTFTELKSFVWFLGLRKSLVNFQTPPRTVNRESPARAQPPLPKTSPSIHGDSHFSGGWERRFTTLAGAIHTLAGSIHTLVHTFWQGIRHFWRSLDRLRHSHTTLRQSLSLRRRLHSGASNLVRSASRSRLLLVSCFAFFLLLDSTK